MTKTQTPTPATGGFTALDGLELPIEHAAEYDVAAQWCAKRGLKGIAGDPLPPLMAQDGALKYIQADPEAFEDRVRECAYALAAGGKEGDK